MELHCYKCCLKVFYIKSSIETFHEFVLVIRVLYVSRQLAFFRYVVDDVNIIHLLKFNLSQQPIEVDSSIVDVVDLRIAETFFHSSLRADHIHD